MKAVERLTAQLRDLQGRLSALEQSDSTRGNNEAHIPFLVEMLETRRQRDVLFGPDLFSDPAWDIFLELYLAELEDRKVLVSSVGRGAIAETTALRWLDRLEAGDRSVGCLTRCSDAAPMLF
jgi:hypothetical protein